VAGLYSEPDKTLRSLRAVFADMLVGTRAGSSYSEPEYASLLCDAGFSDVRRLRLPGPVGLMIAAGAYGSPTEGDGTGPPYPEATFFSATTTSPSHGSRLPTYSNYSAQVHNRL